MQRSRTLTAGIIAGAAALAVVGVMLVAAPQAATAGPQTVVLNYGYTGATTTFTVPDGVTQLSIAALGGQGGRGGKDYNGFTPGGYAGQVAGTMAVTPGQVLTIAVGGGGGQGGDSKGSAPGGAGGGNPLNAYKGGTGGVAGSSGSSGGGGGGGGATVITTGSTTIVAGGGGGNGGDGQWDVLAGRVAYATHTDNPAGGTIGQNGLNVNSVCTTACDGGASGAGGGGAIGGAQGGIEFGTGQYTEWFGYGGYPGSNATGNVSGLGASYQYYAANSGDGSLSISYVTGAPDTPTAVSGIARDGGADLAWNAPVATGQSPISDYVVQYALASDPTDWTSFSDAVSTDTATTVTGLVNGTAYVFRVAAVSAAGTGGYSDASAPITPVSAPAAPTALVASPRDGALSVAFTAAVSGSPVLDYQYRIGSGDWVSTGSTTSPVLVPGLHNGTSYTLQLRAVSAIGAGDASDGVTGIPVSVPGAPSITSITTDSGTATVVFAPGSSGGAPISDYEYQLDGTGGWVSASTTTSPATIGGLAAGSTHSVALRAVNASGPGAASQTSTITLPGAPGAPGIDGVTSGDGSLAIAFTPGTTGGSPVTAYQYQLTAGGEWATATALTSPIVVTGLVNGTACQVSVRAVNTVGAGAASAAVPATPATTPGAPSIVGDTVSGSDATLTAAFTAPGSDGGSAITGYEYSTDGGATWSAAVATTTSPLTITTLSADGSTPLTNGTVYHVELRAINAKGAGTASAVASGIALATPSAPTIDAVTAAPSSLVVAFTAGSNGGAAITQYQYRLDGGDWKDTGSLGTGFTVAGLDNGHAYSVQVRAVNSQGDGAASNALSGTPVALPGRPIIDSVTRADRSLTIALQLPDDGGSPVTAWEYTTDGGSTWSRASGTTSPLTITTLSGDGATRLANSTAYPVAVRAITAVGTGVASATTTSAPSTTPNAPTVTLASGNRDIQVTYALSGDGGSPITAIEYSLDGGDSWHDAGSLASPFTITGLDNGTAYAVRVRADNVIGSGAASADASTTPRTVPDAPTTVAALSDTAQADVSWQAPASDGGSAVTGYVASAYASSTSTTAIASCTSPATACAIGGLVNGTPYYVSVVAQNEVGSGVASSPRVLVTPLARPSAPAITGITAGNAFLTVNFTAGSAGGSPITGYDYQLNGGSWIPAGVTSSPITLSGLSNGTSYSVRLRADSAAGTGAASDPVVGTPYTQPDGIDPATIVADAQNGQIVVSWPAANANGSPITKYDVVAWSAATMGTQAKTCTTSGALTCTLAGLANGTTYYVSLQATNAAGASVRSDPRVPATPSFLPGAVSSLTGTPGDGQVALSWTAASQGASAITDYQVSYSSGGAYTLFPRSASTATSAVVTGLTNGVHYTFKVVAVNGNGTSTTSAVSSPIAPVGPGVAPSTSTPVRTADGYTFTIGDYDPALDYAVSATHGTATRNGATVTVTGLSAGDSSTVTVTASSAAIAPASATVTASALDAGVTPTFSTPVKTLDGYTFTITNLDPDADYTLTATHGTVTRSGSTVTVSGLGLGGDSDVTVTATVAGRADASATQSAAAMSLGTAPTFSPITRHPNGFSATITNYSSVLSYTFGATNGATVSASGATVTVTGLAPGASSEVTVTATDPGESTASAVVSGSALQSGTVPQFSAPRRAADGYAFDITNYDSGVDYGITASNGATVARSEGTVTVTGLAPGAASTTTVIASRDGFTTTSATVDGSALGAGVTPLFSAPTRTPDGFTFEIANPSADGGYTLSASAGTATLTGSTVTVTGLAAGQASTVLVTNVRDGYTDASSSQSGAALDAGRPPALSPITRTADGFSFSITDYDPALVYTLTTDPGATVRAIDGDILVSGLEPGAGATVHIAVTDPGSSYATADAPGTALDAGVPPIVTDGTPLAGGYSFEITNYSADYTYSYDVSDGGSAVRTGSTVTVSGLSPATVGSTVVTATRDGYTTTTATATGSSFGPGSIPSISAITRTADGFTFSLLNLSADYHYAVTSDAGRVALSGGTVTATGLGSGRTTTVHLVTSRAGELDESADVAGRSLDAGVAPRLSSPRPTAGGFVFTIANYSPDFAYSFAATGHARVTANGAQVTVAGLTAGVSAAVTVTATRNGYLDASGTVRGAAAPSSTATATSGAATAGDASASAQPGTGSDGGAQQQTIELRPGTGSVTVDGSTMTPTVTPMASGVRVAHGGLSIRFTLTGKDHRGSSVSGSTITVVPGGKLRVTVSGFRPGTQASVWGHSTPVLLSSPTVGSDKRAADDFALPTSFEPGQHTLVVSGTSDAGDPVSLAVGFVVAAPKTVHAAADASDSGSFMIWLWTAIALVVAILVVFLVLALRRRRRHDDEEDNLTI